MLSGPLQAPLSERFDAVEQGWRDVTEAFRSSPAGQNLIARVEAARQQGAVIYPDNVFAALRSTPRDQVKVVILGQDPYHGPGQAHGLAFSVPSGQPVPPSLRNIRKELARDVGCDLSGQGCLQAWADRGVLLLNTALTVEDGRPGSHAGWGWEALTDALIAAVAADRHPCVFMLWGAHAQRKRALIEQAAAQSAEACEHLILQANHPSPLSATRGPAPFIGCGHFGLALAFWRGRGVHLDWAITHGV